MLSAALLTIDDAPAAFSTSIWIAEPPATPSPIATIRRSQSIRRASYLTVSQPGGGADAGIRAVDRGAGDGDKQTLGAVQGPALRDWLLVRPGLPALLGRVTRTMARERHLSRADAFAPHG